jgi:hypothetical protein
MEFFVLLQIRQFTHNGVEHVGTNISSTTLIDSRKSIILQMVGCMSNQTISQVKPHKDISCMSSIVQMISLYNVCTFSIGSKQRYTSMSTYVEWIY